jgi:3-methyladenine DNA glycosylase AlkD
MFTLSQIMRELEKKGSAQTRKIYANHGAPEEFFGVKIGDLKDIAKKIKGDQELALQLYDTGNIDAMYLAGLVADGSKMTKRQLENWAKLAPWHMISEYTVPFVAHRHPDAAELAMKWIKSPQETVACAGWATYAGILAVRPDDELDLAEIEQLLNRIESEIHTAKNRVRYTMNGFLIGVGGYVKPLLKRAKQVAQKIGDVKVELGKSACKVPLASEYIAKLESMGKVGQKRKSIVC